MATLSHWMEESGRPLDVSRSTSRSVTVAIIGGGIAGWSAAYWLAQRGVEAVVIDPTPSPAGATARNAGFLMTGTASSYRDAIQAWGRDEARRLEQLTFDNRDSILERFFPDRDALQPIGSWRLAECPGEEEELRESLQLLREDGFDYQWIDGGDARRELCSDRFFGGLEQRGDCGVDPLVVVRRISRASGVPLREGRAKVVRRSGASLAVELESGDVISAQRAVVTLNAYTAQLLPEMSERIVPVRAQALTTAPLDRVVWQHLVYSNYGYFYFRQLPDRRLLIGGARHLFREVEVGYEDNVTSGLQTELENFLASVRCADAQVERRWSGVMAFTPDGRPVAGPLHGDDPSILLLGGFNGHGMGMAFESARRLVAEHF